MALVCEGFNLLLCSIRYQWQRRKLQFWLGILQISAVWPQCTVLHVTYALNYAFQSHVNSAQSPVSCLTAAPSIIITMLADPSGDRKYWLQQVQKVGLISCNNLIVLGPFVWLLLLFLFEVVVVIYNWWQPKMQLNFRVQMLLTGTVRKITFKS